MDNSRALNTEVLQLAARHIEKCLIKDNNAPTLLDQLNINPQSGPTASGLSDHDYPALVGLPQSIISRTQMKTLSKVPLPPEIMEHFNHMQCHCMMGLFTEINRAWLTIDSDIYVWTYDDGGDVAYYDGLNETIISVGLVKPKSGVFQNFINYLLVLTTAVDVVVLGVTFAAGDEDSLKEIQLVSDPVFTIPTDGAMMTSIVGTATGRMFLGSKDGCLYEITYQAESTWFGKRCKKLNHSTSKLSFLVPSFAYAAMTDDDGIVQVVIDDTRHILYTLTEKGAIEVYDLGENGTSISRVIKVSQNQLVQQAHNVVKTLDSQNFHPIVSISAVELCESPRINLVALTQSGVRLYLSTSGQAQVNMPLPRPSTLALQHVRMPPGYSASTHYRPKNIHMAEYRDRNLLMVSTVNEKEVLWSISSDLFPFYPILMEATTNIELDGPALAMAEIKYNTNMLLQPTQQVPPLIVRQHSEPPRKFVILTSQGAHILMKLRPVDLLKQLLVDTRGQDSDALKAYFNIQNDEQACATSLILASLEAPQNLDVADYATNAFFVFGGEPKVATPAINNTMNQTFGNPSIFLPNMMSTPMQQHSPFAQTMPMTPQVNFTANSITPVVPHFQPNMSHMYDPNSQYQFSSKHNGLYLYVARILRPIWNLRCVEKMTFDGKRFYLTSTLNSEECAWILCHLTSLRIFLQQTTQMAICNNTTVAKSTNKTGNCTMQDVQLEERHSLDALKMFVDHAAQVLGLWKVLCEHQFHMLMDTFQAEHQQVMQNTCFKDILLYGHDVCATLINTLINSYLGDNASVDSISSKLREICPNLYKNEDAACSKANEILKTAKNVNNLDEKEELLSSALQLCIEVVPNVNLKEICEQFSTQKSYNAVIMLATKCAEKIDPENVGEHFYKNGDQNDQEGYQYYAKRIEIYKVVTAMLDDIYSQNDVTQNINGQVPVETGENITRRVISSILKHKDELLHIAVYEWMMSKQMNGELISVTEPTLETYLLKATQHNPSNISLMDILWKYYESNNNHAAAAKVLNNLASVNQTSLNMKTRLSYLARSLMCMRSDKIGYAPYLGVFLRELEDKLEVAKVQERILEAIVNLKGRHMEADAAEKMLNGKLFDITQLYEDFAEKFNLWECKLAIIDCAGYSDKLLIENIWRNILQNELCRSTSSGNDKMIQILTKVKSLVRLYKTSSTCIPLDYLVQELELISAKLKADTTLVPNFFVSLEYPIDLLINTYNESMIRSLKDNFWLAEENEFHYSEAMAALVNAFVHLHDKYSNVEKRKLIAISQDTVAGLLSNLYSKPNTEHIITLLRSIQNKLSRM